MSIEVIGVNGNREMGARPAFSYFVVLIAIYVAIAFFSEVTVNVVFGYFDVESILNEGIEFWKFGIYRIEITIFSLVFIYLILAWHFPNETLRERFMRIGVKKVGYLPYLVAILAALVFGMLMEIFQEYYLDSHYDTESASSSLTVNSTFGYFLIAVGICVFVPIIEELYFRGLFFYSFQKSWGASIAALLSSILFVSVHASLYRLGSFELVLFFFVLSFIFVALRERYETILPGMALHGVYNLFVFTVN